MRSCKGCGSIKGKLISAVDSIIDVPEVDGVTFPINRVTHELVFSEYDTSDAYQKKIAFF
ncbi:hypothetical protein GCM10022393_20630 [Aquimarina addita]|uniref:Uncharacterized protein n=1 Tax=Aquimarina addita TaxID=870485 RepID=A0ABP6UKI6_9FLAO